MIRETLRHRSKPGVAALALAVSAALLCAAPAAADRLVTRDGSVIETRGAWKVQGRLVVFSLPDGQLASLQLGEVDLEASRAATERSLAPPEEPPAVEPPERTAVLVLTDADVRQAPPLDAGGEEPAEGESSSQPIAPSAAAERLVVSTWDEASGPDGVVITGELVNQSRAVAANIELGVLLYDREGDLLQSAQATVTSEVLQPGQRARFRADVEGVFAFSALQFEAKSLGLEVGAGSEGREVEGADSEGLAAAVPGLEEESPGGEG